MTDLIANWPCPTNVRALTTTRMGGHSQEHYLSNNLALHVGDIEERVLANRDTLKNRLHLASEPVWLEQTHSTRCVLVEESDDRLVDAALTRKPNQALAILTGDCLPIVLCNQQGNEIAAIHAGWRGLLNGIIENTLLKMQSDPALCIAWIGPAICQNCYETGYEVFDAFNQRYPFTANSFIKKNTSWYANLPQIAEQVLYANGLQAVYQSGACTFEAEEQFYSYRRTPQTGRIATLIWFLG